MYVAVVHHDDVAVSADISDLRCLQMFPLGIKETLCHLGNTSLKQQIIND